MNRRNSDGESRRRERAEIAQDNQGVYFEKTLTPQQFIDGCNAYFALCDEVGKKVRIPGLCRHLGISEETLVRLLKAGDGKRKKDGEKGQAGIESAFVFPIKSMLYEVRDRLEQECSASSIFLLKQGLYGGYTDRAATAQQSGNTTVVIKFGDTHKNTAQNWGK